MKQKNLLILASGGTNTSRSGAKVFWFFFLKKNLLIYWPYNLSGEPGQLQFMNRANVLEISRFSRSHFAVSMNSARRN
jgi:hypothetical protein